VERKNVEFDRADFGSIGLESCFGALNLVLDLEKAIKALTGLKCAFKIPETKIEEGQRAELTLFNPIETWTFSEKDIVSTSKNAALLGIKLKGKAYGIFSKNSLLLNTK